MEKDLMKKSRYLSKLLRHEPEDLKMDKNGWVSVEELCQKVDITTDMLDQIVEENDKKRFAYSSDKKRIRASQGHSISIDVQLKEMVPPDVLYHGTSLEAYESIKIVGLTKMKRTHVHLSSDIDTATKVGSRHTKGKQPIILEIDAKSMYKSGGKFYLSENKVWLTDYVPVRYIK